MRSPSATPSSTTWRRKALSTPTRRPLTAILSAASSGCASPTTTTTTSPTSLADLEAPNLSSGSVFTANKLLLSSHNVSSSHYPVRATCPHHFITSIISIACVTSA
nr:uncharacterized protein LOC113830266 [Penaeus vannamei]